MSQPTWVTEVPKAEGWYWVRVIGGETECVLVRNAGRFPNVYRADQLGSDTTGIVAWWPAPIQEPPK